ncbi:small ribosomal subunit protein bS21m [Cynoglossus semilaevis]|uniref:Mitochondrial ribosomal protein S21 n=1 Tax=Cynoglossus semilaevis TaxID=244447 RepID=A0A3P8VDD4_CYNSE|nr:28S ribosomal protein S21, mitochondrial [Cynoglossus semilaevis]
MARHLRFISRTVMVHGENVDGAYSSLNRILNQEGIIDTVRRRRYYEKPCQERRRLCYERCKRIYNMEMGRKIAFISKTNRKDPWLGC